MWSLVVNRQAGRIDQRAGRIDQRAGRIDERASRRAVQAVVRSARGILVSGVSRTSVGGTWGGGGTKIVDGPTLNNAC